MIIFFGIILYLLITGGFWGLAHVSAIGGDQFSNLFYIFLWILILPLLPIIGMIYLIDYIYYMLCYGKTPDKYEKELYEKANKNIIVNKYPKLFDIEILGHIVKLNVIECDGIFYACDNPNSLIKLLKSTNEYCKVYGKKKEKYNGNYKIQLTKDEIKEFMDQI